MRMRCLVEAAISNTLSHNDWPRSQEARKRGHYPLRLDLDDDASADGAATLADGEARPLLQRHRGHQLHANRDVVPRHDHLHALPQLDRPRHIRRADVELRPIAVEEGRVSAPLL